MIQIFIYTDFRCFLKDRLLEHKQKNPSFSYRVFNRLAGIKSSGFLKLVLDGKRNLAAEGIRKIAKGFRLDSNESKYFSNLVHFNQAKTHEEKDHYLKELLKSKGFLKAKQILEAQYALFSHWYYVAILELVRLEDGKVKDAAWIHKTILPTVGLREIKKAIGDLKKLGLLEQGDQGLVRHETMLSTPDEVASVTVANYHVQMSQMAARAVAEEAAQNREFSALTIATSPKGLALAKAEIQEFRKKLHSILEQAEGEPKNVVAHLNLQLFQLSKI